MTTITIDVLNDKALELLKDLELLKIIRVRKSKSVVSQDLTVKYKGSMKAQSVDDVDRQLQSLRNEWE